MNYLSFAALGRGGPGGWGGSWAIGTSPQFFCAVGTWLVAAGVCRGCSSCAIWPDSIAASAP
jgi:hypothetical protein